VKEVVPSASFVIGRKWFVVGEKKIVRLHRVLFDARITRVSDYRFDVDDIANIEFPGLYRFVIEQVLPAEKIILIVFLDFSGMDAFFLSHCV
jgi:hypothetical protein